MPNNLFIVDAHEDIAYHLSYFNRDFVNPSIPCMITLPWLKQGNVRLVFNTIFVPAEFKPHKTLDIALHQLSIYDRIYDEHNDDIFQVKNPGDLFRLQKDSRIGFLTLMEGADPIQEPKELNEFYKRGVRIIGLAWNDQNQYASGNNTDSGLTKQGIELIKRMNDLRITLDLSHLNEKCFWEAIELCETIPIASHSNARSLTNHPRNLKDDQIRAISERGGVIGLVLYNHFLKTCGENLTCGDENRTTLEDIFAHADYIIKLCGEDYVGIGSDLDGAGVDDFPKEIRSVADLPKIGEFFLKKGYTEQRVKKIMNGNFLRVLKENS
ncbi:MAG TPA: dipeptidase [Thermodesulfobacteriota bacterium]|nr:dipeptidase [Thermodesulfobacteriota bacterium]